MPVLLAERGHDPFWQAVRVFVSRRRLLLGAGVALASACTVQRGPRRPTALATGDPRSPLLAGATGRERVLLAAYDDVLAQHPDLAPELSSYREDHAAHLHALEPGVVVSATVTPSTRRTSRRDAARARDRLRLLESRTATAYARAAVAAPPEHAALLASLAACEATHAELL